MLQKQKTQDLSKTIELKLASVAVELGPCTAMGPLDGIANRAYSLA